MINICALLWNGRLNPNASITDLLAAKCRPIERGYCFTEDRFPWGQKKGDSTWTFKIQNNRILRLIREVCSFVADAIARPA
jgi:hypothetical protein